jgi:ATP-dependent Clp protease ATP-binding subunit ClpC
MFERFTDRARRLVVLAQEEARRLGHNYIGTEHLLLAIVIQDDSVAARVLASFGVSGETVRTDVVARVHPGAGSPEGHVPFTPRAKKVLELSLREAMQLNHNFIGTEHILLGLLREGDGVGAQLLRSYGVDLTAARQRVADAVPQPSAESVSASAVATPQVNVVAYRSEEEHPLCPVCASALGETLKWRRVAASGEGEGAEQEAVVAYCGSCGRALGVLP